MEEQHQSDRNSMENASIGSELGIVQPQEMNPPNLNSDDFPPLCNQPARVNSPQSTRAVNLQQPEPQNSPTTDPPQTVNLPQAPKSFVDAVNSQSNTSSFPRVRQHSYLAGAPPPTIGVRTESQGLPKIQFSVEETARLSEHFKFAIVGKFSHGFPPYRNMHRLLSTLKLQGPFTVTMITNRHVLINLKNEEDFTKLWIQRLWHIDGFPMRTFKWTPSFRPQHESSLAPVWIRFPILPAHLFHKDTLHVLASLVGTPLKLDEPTLFQSRLNAARVCVEVDLANKLVEKIAIGIGEEEIVQEVIFENLPKYCMLCKHIGHEAQHCYTKGNAPKPQRFAHQQKGKAKIAPRQNARGAEHVENVIFEIGEPSNSKRKDNVAFPIGIESKNNFTVLSLEEAADNSGRGPENDLVGRNVNTETTGAATTSRQKESDIAETPRWENNDSTMGVQGEKHCNVEGENLEPDQIQNHGPIDASVKSKDTRYHADSLNFFMQNMPENDDLNAENDGRAIQSLQHAVANHESPAPLSPCLSVFNIPIANVTVKRSYNTSAFNATVGDMDIVGDVNVVEHCEGVAMEAPLTIPPAPNPFDVLHYEDEIEGTGAENDVSEEVHSVRYQPCTLNQAKQARSGSDLYLDTESEFSHHDHETDEVEQISDQASEEVRSVSSASSLEDCLIRSKHKRTNSVGEVSQPGNKFNFDSQKMSTEFRILTRSRSKHLTDPNTNQSL
ncbi:UNVERIFIED_CONTAM: hypothetical protein Sradi_4095400 [Sesamum radiatum]|uniref:DUF4283 domain-containing protein n=1 Tax=Sesamum radiatum TaxID=300843 RepID=A0AAW2P0Q5_SESRA